MLASAIPGSAEPNEELVFNVAEMKTNTLSSVPASLAVRMLACLLLCFLCVSAALAQVQDQARGQAAAQSTRDVEVSVVVYDIDAVDSVAESFVANFYMEFSWMDPSLAHPGPDSTSRDLADIWHPRIQILNEQNLVRTFPESAEIRPDGEVIYRQRVWGSLSQPLVLNEFPFDSQKLEIVLIGTEFGSTRARFLISPHSAVAEHLTIPDWTITDWDFSAVDLPVSHKTPPIPGMVFSLDVKRDYSFFTLKVIFPLILIVAMSWLVFWIDPSLASTQISVAITAMLTLIAYRFAIGDMVPKLAFLTSLDYFVLGSTILIFISLLEVVYTSYLVGRDQLTRARSIDLICRWLMPLLFVVMVVETLVLRIGI